MSGRRERMDKMNRQWRLGYIVRPLARETKDDLRQLLAEAAKNTREMQDKPASK